MYCGSLVTLPTTVEPPNNAGILSFIERLSSLRSLKIQKKCNLGTLKCAPEGFFCCVLYRRFHCTCMSTNIGTVLREVITCI